MRAAVEVLTYLFRVSEEYWFPALSAPRCMATPGQQLHMCRQMTSKKKVRARHFCLFTLLWAWGLALGVLTCTSHTCSLISVGLWD